MLKAMPGFVVFLLAQILSVVSSHKGCGFHTELGREFRGLREQHAAETRSMHKKLTQIRKGRSMGLLRLQPTSPQPIRFHVSYQINNLEPVEQALLRDRVVPIALRALQDRIKVKEPIDGRLTLPVTCTSVYVSGNECAQVLDPSFMTCGYAVPEKEHYGEYEICSYDAFFRFSCTVKTFGDGVSNADFILYVTAFDGAECGEGTAAFAHHCENDIETHRPLSGTINMCPSFFRPSESLLQQIETITHEVLHALIFNPELWSVFIDAEGNSLEKSNVVKESPPAIVSPKALNAARSHFGCADMTGVPLENQGPSGTVGAHWDSRFLQGELMDPVAGPQILYSRHVISSITLGLIDDSGWYESIPDKAGYLRWGKDAGCDFLTQSCQSYAVSHPGQPFFCDTESWQGCVPGATAIGQCTGHDETMDGCLLMAPFSNGDCLQSSEVSEAGGVASGIFLDAVGPTSRCLGVEAPLFRGQNGFNSLVLPYRCYKLFCVGEELYLEIGNVNARCFAGQMIDLAESFGSLEFIEGKIGPCPDNAQACASLSCPSHCSMRGTCVDGTCACFLGFSGPACSFQLCSVDANCPDLETCQVLTELASSEQYFEANVRTIYTRSIATAANVNLDQVAIVTTAQKQVPLENSQYHQLTNVKKENRHGITDQPNMMLDHPRGLKQTAAVVVESRVAGDGGTEPEAELADIEFRLGSNWERFVVVELRSVGVEVLKRTLTVITVDGANPTEMSKDGTSIELFGQNFSMMYLLCGLWALAFFCVAFCCCCYCRFCKTDQRYARTHEMFWNVSGTSHPEKLLDRRSHPNFSGCVQPLQADARCKNLEMSLSPVVQATGVDASEVSLSLGSHRPQGRCPAPGRLFHNNPDG